jgi:hypothetical protein
MQSRNVLLRLLPLVCFSEWFSVFRWPFPGIRFLTVLDCLLAIFAVSGGFQHHKPQFRGFPGTRF